MKVRNRHSLSTISHLMLAPRLLSTLAVGSATVLLNACSARPSGSSQGFGTGNEPLDRFHLEPPEKKLFVNLNAGHHYKIEKSEADGIQDLRTLTETKESEEIWMCLTATDQEGALRTFWYEVGEKESKHGADFRTAMLRSIAQDVTQEGLTLKEWRQYHFHSRYNPKYFGEEPPHPDLKKMPYEAYLLHPKDYFSIYAMSVAATEMGLRLSLPNVGLVIPGGTWFLDWKVQPSEKASEIMRHSLPAEAAAASALYFILEKTVACGPPVFLCSPTDEDYRNYERILSTPWVTARFMKLK